MHWTLLFKKSGDETTGDGHDLAMTLVPFSTGLSTQAQKLPECCALNWDPTANQLPVLPQND